MESESFKPILGLVMDSLMSVSVIHWLGYFPPPHSYSNLRNTTYCSFVLQTFILTSFVLGTGVTEKGTLATQKNCRLVEEANLSTDGTAQHSNCFSREAPWRCSTSFKDQRRLPRRSGKSRGGETSLILCTRGYFAASRWEDERCKEMQGSLPKCNGQSLVTAWLWGSEELGKMKRDS